MPSSLKRKLAIGITAAAAVGFAGGAYAATQGSSTNPRQQFLDDVAKRLHVTPAQLSQAFRGAALDQVQAAVAAGKLTQAEANAIKKRIEQGEEFPPLGVGPLAAPQLSPGPGFFGPPGLPGPPELFAGPGQGPMAAAAKYLGVTELQLFQQLGNGKSLAQIAKAKGKSITALKAAMLAALKARLDRAVAAKRLPSSDEQALLKALSARLDIQINQAGPGLRFHFHIAGGPMHAWKGWSLRGWAPPIAGSSSGAATPAPYAPPA